MLVQPFYHCRNGFLVVHSVELSGIDHLAFRYESLLEVVEVDRRIFRIDYRDNVETERLGEIEVPLVMSRYGHDGSGTVAHEYVIGDVDRYFLSVYRIDSISAQEHSRLLIRCGSPLDVGHAAGLLLILEHCGLFRTSGDQFVYERMLRRHYHVCRSEKRVSSCCKYFEDLVGILYFEIDVGAVALAYPVALHGLDLVRPAFELVQVVQQPVGIVCDLEIPL